MAETKDEIQNAIVQAKPTSANNPVIRKPNTYLEFILWSAMPDPEKIRMGLEWQKDFAEYYHLEESTLSRWKQRPDFQDRVRKIIKMWAFDKTPNVVQSIYRSAIKGNSDSQRIWLQYFEGWSEKTQVEHVIKVQMAPGDLRFVIDGMPEEYKQKFYGYIREIIDTAVALRNAGKFQDGYAEDPALEGDILEQADQDAPDVPDQPAGEVPESDSISIRADMVWAIHPRHYQSPERWR